jgi:NAD+ kinase
MMPIDLVLVRHGESEGNAVKAKSKAGDHSAVQLFRGRHSSSFRLTDKGVEQAKAAGVWLREHVPQGFGRHYTSAYLRAMETAGHLALHDASWFCEPALRERDWGDLDVMGETERYTRYRESLVMKKTSPLYWIAPNGESIMHATERVYRMLGTLARECADKRVVIVAHGETMWCFRLLLERLSEERYNELDASHDPMDRIHNCQILHYTRRVPGQEINSTSYSHMRSICPWDTQLSSNEWMPIVRLRYTSQDLLEIVSKTERLVRS